MSEVLSLIPCRGGSKGIPRKNLREVAGEPMLAHTVRASLDAEAVDRTVVSTDDDEIHKAALQAGADVPFLRPDDLATDEAPVEPSLEHALTSLRDKRGEHYDTLALLQATSPCRTALQIDEAVNQYREQDADSLVAVTEDHGYRWERTGNGAEIINYESRKRRQDKDPEFVETGAIYLVDVERFLATGNLQVGRTALYVMDRISAVDVDDPFDIWLAEKILSEWRK